MEPHSGFHPWLVCVFGHRTFPTKLLKFRKKAIYISLKLRFGKQKLRNAVVLEQLQGGILLFRG